MPSFAKHFIIVQLAIYQIWNGVNVTCTNTEDQEKCMSEIKTLFKINAPEFRTKNPTRNHYLKNAMLYLRAPDDENITTGDNLGDEKDPREYYFMIYNYLSIDKSFSTPLHFCAGFSTEKERLCKVELKKYFKNYDNDELKLLQWAYKNIILQDIDVNDKQARKYYEKVMVYRIDADKMVVNGTKFKYPSGFCKEEHPSTSTEEWSSTRPIKKPKV